ncbi:GM20180, partial [Drosophila sechellia]
IQQIKSMIAQFTGWARLLKQENAEKMKEIFELVRRNMKRAAQDQGRHYNLRRRP